MEIVSGDATKYIHFYAVDAADLITPETGLSAFGVRHSRDDGSAGAFTTPSITEVDSSNMPGWYKLLIDEQYTLDSGNDCEEVALHITHAGMHPAKVKYLIKRAKITAGNTLSVESDGDLTKVNTLDSAYDFAKGTVAMTEAYAANGAAPTPVEALYGIQQMLQMFAISGTSLTVKKLDNATTAFVVTLNDATSPTGAART